MMAVCAWTHPCIVGDCRNSHTGSTCVSVGLEAVKMHLVGHQWGSLVPDSTTLLLHPEELWGAWEVGPCEPCEVEQGQVQGLAHGWGQSQAQIQAGKRMDWEQPWGEGLGGAGWWETHHDLATCIHNPESQLCPGLHQKQRGQQIKGGYSAPSIPLWWDLTWSPLSNSGVLSTGKTWTHWSSPEEGHKIDQRGETLPLWGKAETVGAGGLSLEKRRLWGDLIAVFQHLKGAYKRATERLFTSACSDRTMDNVFKLKKGWFRLDRRKKFFMMRVVSQWHRLPLEVVAATSLEVFKTRLDGALSNLV